MQTGFIFLFLMISPMTCGWAGPSQTLSQPSPLDTAKSLVSSGRPGEAVPYLNQALATNPRDREAQRTMARALLDLYQFLPAQELLEKLTRTDPNDGESWYYLGLLMYRNGYYGAALPALEKSLATRPDNPKARVYRAVCLSKLARAKEAEAAFLDLSENSEAVKDPDFLLVYAELLFETGRAEASLRQVDRALASLPGSPIGYFWRGRILLHLNRVDDAAKAAEHSVNLAPQLPFARNLLVQIYRKQGRTADAAQQANWLREYEARMTPSQQP
jgi:tetratricopeptide (TPR) repeat protein